MSNENGLLIHTLTKEELIHLSSTKRRRERKGVLWREGNDRYCEFCKSTHGHIQEAQVETSRNTHLKAEGNLEQVARSNMPINGILLLRRKLSSDKTSIRFSRRTLIRAKSRDNLPSLNVIQTGGKTEDAQMHPPYDQRSAEWNEEQEEFSRQKAYKLHKGGLQHRRTLQRCPQHKLLQKLRPCTGEEYRDRLGDTFQRKSVHGSQWRFVAYDGIIFAELQSEEDYSTVDHNSAYSDRLCQCGLREHKQMSTWRSFGAYLCATFGGTFTVGAIVGKTMRWVWFCLFVGVRRNSQIIQSVRK